MGPETLFNLHTHAYYRKKKQNEATFVRFDKKDTQR